MQDEVKQELLELMLHRAGFRETRVGSSSGQCDEKFSVSRRVRRRGGDRVNWFQELGNSQFFERSKTSGTTAR